MARVSLVFNVHGPPAAQGSKTAGRARSGRVFMRESSAKVKPFRQACAAAALEAGARVDDGYWALSVIVYAVRPQSHYTKSGALRKGAPALPGGHDASKVLRAIEDALAGVVWRNDRQVRREDICFCWSEHGARVRVACHPI